MGLFSGCSCQYRAFKLQYSTWCITSDAFLNMLCCFHTQWQDHGGTGCVSDYCPGWDRRERKYQVRGFAGTSPVHRGRGQKFMVCKARQQLSSSSASPHCLQGCGARDTGASSSTGNAGVHFPVTKGQSLTGDEQSCKEKLHWAEWRFLLFRRRC